MKNQNYEIVPQTINEIECLNEIVELDDLDLEMISGGAGSCSVDIQCPELTFICGTDIQAPTATKAIALRSFPTLRSV